MHYASPSDEDASEAQTMNRHFAITRVAGLENVRHAKICKVIIMGGVSIPQCWPIPLPIRTSVNTDTDTPILTNARYFADADTF